VNGAEFTWAAENNMQPKRFSPPARF